MILRHPCGQNAHDSADAAAVKSARKAGSAVIAKGAIQANSSAWTKNENAIQYIPRRKYPNPNHHPAMNAENRGRFCFFEASMKTARIVYPATSKGKK
ncbi:MAG: hypothetical protein KJN99_11340 [Marinicaulis sp.]|nr:hypothetical protein [Marinicaulis sp.]